MVEATTLHILVSASDQNYADLPKEGIVQPGDLVADLRPFPPRTVHMTASGPQTINLELDSERDYFSVAKEWLTHFSIRTKLQEQVTVEGQGVWWMLIAQDFVPVLTEAGNAFVLVDYLQALKQRCAYDQVVVHGEARAAVSLVEQFFGEINHAGLESMQRSSGSRIAAILEALRISSLLVLRVLMGIVYLLYSQIRRPDICVFGDSNLLRIVGQGSSRRLKDVYLDDVIVGLRARGHRVALIEKFGPNASFTRLLARRFFLPSDILWLLRYNWFHPAAARNARNFWKSRSTELRTQMVYKGYDISDILEPFVQRAILQYWPQIGSMAAIWRKLFRLWRPHVVLVNNGYGQHSLSGVLAAKSLGIETVEQQHGVIGQNHFVYLVPKSILEVARYPLCDRISLWGNYFMRLLGKHDVGVLSELVVCGFPPLDALGSSSAFQSPRRTTTELAKENCVLLYTSNGFANDIVEPFLDAVVAIDKQLGLTCLVKLHPREKTLLRWLREAERRKIKNLHVLESQHDLHALMAACDIHVSMASTTLIEAALIGKPNIFLEIPEIGDPAGYVDSGFCTPIPLGRLPQTVSRLMNQPIEAGKLVERQRARVSGWCIADGGSVARIIDLVESSGRVQYQSELS